MNIPRFLELYREGRTEDAFLSIILDNPLPASTGRVCQHPCDTRCRRQSFDEVVNMREVHRHIADATYATDHFEPAVARLLTRKLAPTGKKVSVAGSGPTGLTAAFYLAMLGHDVTVFEERAMKGQLGSPRSHPAGPLRLTALASVLSFQKSVKNEAEVSGDLRGNP
jgi:NADH-quinone oxidoreductase subunit F